MGELTASDVYGEDEGIIVKWTPLTFILENTIDLLGESEGPVTVVG